METDKIMSSYRTAMGNVQKTVDVVLQREDESAILKVLSNNAVAYLDDIEMLNGEARFSGGVVFNCLYVDNQGKNHVLSEKVDLNGKFENPIINPLMKPIYKVEVVEIRTESVDDDRVRIVATMDIIFDCVVTDELEQIKPQNGMIEALSENIQQHVVVASGEKTFRLTEQYDTKNNIERVLLSSAHTMLKGVTSGTGYFTVEGDVFVNSVLEVVTDEGVEIKNFVQTLPFKEEIEDETIQKDDLVYAFVYTKPDNYSVTAQSEQDGNSEITVDVNVTVKYIAMRVAECQVYTDAFSTTNKTNVVRDSFVVTKRARTDYFKTTIEGQTTIGENEPRIAKICAVTGEHVTIANSGVVDGELTIEGVVFANVVYLTDDDIQEKTSIDLEIPFSSKFDATDWMSDNIFVTAHIVDIEAKARKGKEINASVDVVFTVDGHSTENMVLVKDIELTEELLPKDYSLAIYIAPKGSTLWDVSKHLLVSESTLLEQNSNLVFPLETAQSIVYFRQRT